MLKNHQTMKKLIIPAVLILTSAFLSSCVATTTMPIAATGVPIGNKVSKVTQTCYFNIICNNNETGVLEAARKGGIEQDSTVDVKYKRVLGGVITQKTIIVSGK
jgi:hypothetical protein